MKDREPGLDLLRCLGLLLVVTFHSFLNNGYYTELQTGAAMLLAGSVRWLSTGCIGIFLMLTGYLKGDRTDFRSCYRGLLPVLLGYYLAAAVSIPVRHFLLGDRQSFPAWIGCFFGFSAVYYGWYVKMYVGLTLLSPLVNLALAGIRQPKELMILIAAMLAVTALPGATPLPLMPDYWRSAYPLTYYILGAAVRRLQPKIPSWVGLTAAAGAALLMGTATVLSTDGDLSSALIWEFPDLWVTVIALGLFLACYRLKTGPLAAKLLTFGAGGCYGGYLLSHLLDAWCYRLTPVWRTPTQYPKLFFAVTLPVFLLCVLGGNLLQWTVGAMVNHRKAVRL